MVLCNYHTHTYRCMHADGKDEEYVLAAIKGGYKVLGFSDHSPWHYDSNYISSMRMKESEFEGYYQSISALKEKYKDKIDIKIGLECEYFPKYLPWLKNLIKKYDLDYVILGNHYELSDERRVYFGTLSCYDEVFLSYINLTIEGMKTGIYTYLAHPDLFMRGRSSFDELARKESIRLCQVAKELNIPLEYNLEGLHYNQILKMQGYPHDEFWKIAAQVGNQVIVGVDAHTPSSLSNPSAHFQAIEYLKSLKMDIIEQLDFEK